MTYRQAHKTARDAEQALHLEQQVTLASLQTMIANQRQQALVIDELPGLSGADLCGIWLVCDDKDLVLHATTKSPWHRQQIILHEFSHMILQHDRDATNGAVVRELLPNLDPTDIRLALHRRSFTDEVELTAELLADRLAARIRKTEGLTSEHMSFGEVFG